MFHNLFYVCSRDEPDPKTGIALSGINQHPEKSQFCTSLFKINFNINFTSWRDGEPLVTRLINSSLKVSRNCLDIPQYIPKLRGYDREISKFTTKTTDLMIS